MDHLFVSIQPVCVFSLDHLHLIINIYFLTAIVLFWICFEGLFFLLL